MGISAIFGNHPTANAIKSIAVGMLGRASNQISAVVLMLMATQFLLPADFGTFALAAAFVTFARTMLYTGAFEYLVKAENADDCASDCLAVTVGMSLAWVVLLILVGLAAPFIFSSATTGLLLLALAPSPVISAIASWQESLLFRQGRLNAYYLVTALIEYATVGLAIALLFQGFGVWSLAIQIYARAVLLALAYVFMVKLPRMPWPSGKGMREVIGWSIPRYSSVTLTFGSNYGADIVLGIFLGPAATGIYRASNRIATAVADIFAQPANLLSISILSRNKAKSVKPEGQWLSIFSAFALIGFPALGGLAILADELVPLMLADEWIAAVPVLMVMCVIRMVSLVGVPASTNLVVLDRQVILLRQQVVMVTLNIAVTCISAPFGSVAVALALLATGLANMVWLLRLNFRIGTTSADVRRSLAVVVPPTLLACGGAWAGNLAASYMGASPLQVLASAIGLSVALWLAAVAVMRRKIATEMLALRH